MRRTMVVSVFAGCGKTWLANHQNKYGYSMRDSDSSTYEKTAGWEKEYINSFMKEAKSGKYDFIFVCQTESVIDEMDRQKIPYVIVEPDNIVWNEQESKERAKERQIIKQQWFGRFILRDNSHMPTQGLDIQLGDRVISTAQFDTIWDRVRHPSFNAFTGVVAIDITGLPRGFLNTLANKSNIDLSDKGWRKIFDAIAENVKPLESEPLTLGKYAQEFANRLVADTGNEVELQFPLYANRTRIDVLEHIDESHCKIYDFMSGVATLKSVTELRTHWDGMVAQGIQPVSAVMFCNKRGPMLKHTCDEMNTLVQAMNDEDFYMTLEAAGGDASKMPHYNFDVILDQNIPVKK